MQLSKNDFQQPGRKEDGVTGNRDPTKAAAKEKGDGSKHFLEEIFNINIFHITSWDKYMFNRIVSFNF